MPTPKKRPAIRVATKPLAKAAVPAREQRRFWLNYPTRLITRPLIWEMARKFPIVFNIRQASVTDEIGILCLELDGTRADLKAAVTWLEKLGVRVEPVEINVLES